MSELLQYLVATRPAFQDPRRLNSLYGDFAAHEHSNPEGYRANSEEWRSALIAAAREGILPTSSSASSKLHDAQGSHFVVQTGDHLLRALETKQYGIPVALGRVVEDAVKFEALIEVKDFKSAEQSIYRRKWLPSVPSLSDILIWTWRQVGFGSTSPHSLPDSQWVIPENLEAASTMFLKYIDNLTSSASSSVSSVLTSQSILHSLPVQLSDSDVSLLLLYLTRDKPRLSYRQLPDGTTIIKQGTSPITETDMTIATLKNLHANLSSQIPTLEQSITQLDQQARAAISLRNTTSARAALKRKKLIAEALDRRQDQAFSIQQTLEKIDQAADNVAMVRAMESSGNVLRQLNAEIGGVEGTERVSDALAEEMSSVDEIAAVLNEPGVGVAGQAVEDETEVDEEFEALMREEERKREEQERKRRDEQVRAEAQTQVEDLEEWERRQRAMNGAPAEVPQQDDKQVEQATKEIAELTL